MKSEPRLIDDRKTLVLLEEISEPNGARQPQIDVGTDPTSGNPQVRIGGRGMKEAPNLSIVCGSASDRLWVSSFAETGGRHVAKYAVAGETAAAILASPPCHLMILGVQLPIPQKLLSEVWSRALSFERQ
jgi:hypothetical protein